MKTGNHVIFIHPDGTSPSHYAAARFVEQGPDGRLNWDKLEKAGVYLGHMEEQLGGTSNGGAVTHATGAKVYAESFGFEQGNTPIKSLAGNNKTIVEEARDAGKVTALVQSGAIFEPGTAAFVAKTKEIVNPDGSRTVPRAQQAEIAKQVINSGVNFILGGGELNLIPVGEKGFHGTAAEYDALSKSALVRPTENLIELAKKSGYTVVYNEQQLKDLLDPAKYPTAPTKVLGVFAPIHTFNDRPEEVLAASKLPLYAESAPTIGEMLEVTQKLMEKHPNFKNGSIAIVEEEGSDNFGNNNNAAGTIEGTLRADKAIGVALGFIDRYPNTLLLTAADSDAGGLQVVDVASATAPVGTINNNPTTVARPIPLDGKTGAGTAPFISAPDANGDVFPFAVAWASTPDFSGSIVSKAHGLNSDKLPATVDNTVIYELMYETLFEKELTARNTVAPKAPAATKDTGNVIFIHPDGTSPSHYMALRNIDKGPDGRLNWDNLSNAGVYLGHMENQLTGTSNAGAVTHATGKKVFNESFGLEENNSTVVPFSGNTGKTILEEAIEAGKATALIQSGHLAEPGSAAFAAKTTNRDGNDIRARDKYAEIIEQVVRSGTNVIFGGGELYMLPKGTTGFHVTAAIDAAESRAERRPTINLIDLAKSLGYTVVYTEDQMNQVVNSAKPPEKILGVFAAIHTFDDRTEEALGLNTATPKPLYVATAPTVAEMLEASLKIVKRDPDGFFITLEEEGTDNFANNNNAAGTIEALRRADAAIGVAMGNFVVNWVGTPDFPGSIVSKAYGLNADKLPSTLDNTEIYKLMYQTLFGTDSRKTLVPGTGGADKLFAGKTPGFDGVNDLIFTGAGNDEVDVTLAGSIAGNNRIDAGSGSDEIFVSNFDRVFGSAGEDIFNANEAKDYRMSGGAGQDTLFLGANGRALGGDGNDKFFASAGGNNLLSGGAGADQFWIANAELPSAANTILDFQIGTDVIGIQGAKSLGISSTTLKLTQVGADTSIDFGGKSLALLTGIQASSLTPAQFVFA